MPSSTASILAWLLLINCQLTLAANYFPVTVADLIADITAANASATNDVINLGGGVFTLITANNVTNGENGLPSINNAGFSLTITNGTIQRGTTAPAFRLLHVAANTTLILDDVTLQNGLAEEVLNGTAQGGAIYSLGTLNIDNSTFNLNTASGFNGIGNGPVPASGGAIYVANGNLSSVTNSIFTLNQALGGDAQAALNITGGAARGGAIAVAPQGTAGTISNTSFIGNIANGGDAAGQAGSGGTGGFGFGGAISGQNTEFVSIIDSTFSVNTAIGGNAFSVGTGTNRAGADGAGGALYLDTSNVTTISGSEFQGNQSFGGNSVLSGGAHGAGGEARGGAIEIVSGTISAISTSTLTGNQAFGANSLLAGVLSMECYGGALNMSAATITLIDASTFSSNLCQGGNSPAVNQGDGIGRGGAIFLEASGATASLIGTIQNSTVANNIVQGGDLANVSDGAGLGAGIYVDSAMAGTTQSTINAIVNSTFSGNIAENHGGALDIFGVSRILLISSSTIVNNTTTTALGGGGIYIHDPGLLGNLVSTIVANNQDGGDNAGQDITLETVALANIAAASFNLIGTAGGHTITNTDNNQVGTDLVPLDPMLGPLQNNGGSTDTHALLLTSTAIDAGADPGTTNDQRGTGFVRVFNGQADIGSYELQACVVDTDGDGVCDDVDNCDLNPNPAQEDGDSDGVGNLCDNCPITGNTLQADGDLDGIGDACDPCPLDNLNDPDGDGICSNNDNCPFKANPIIPPELVQDDTDNDGMGDACDVCPADADVAATAANEGDTDGDGICNSYDICPADPLNVCISFTDTDTDGIPDDWDNCVNTINPDQQNHDDDALGDACDTCTDADNDGVGDAGFTTTGCLFPNIADNCRFKENPIIPPELVQDDTDADGMGDACDVCPGDADAALTPANEADTDNDGLCNSHDICPADPTNTCISFVDTDTDGIPDDWDNCVSTVNADQQNHDDDALGDACDTCTDADNDGVGDAGFTTTGCPFPNIADNCRFKENPIIPPELVQDDTDADGMGDACDVCPADADLPLTAANESDTDGDGRCNSYDDCPTDPTNTCISLVDTDIDGVPDGSDNCPTTSNADQQNHDDDALGDACDTCTDADNDGVGDAGFTTTGCLFPNIADNCRFKENPIIPPELVQADTDADGMGDACDVCPADADLPLTAANESDTDGDGRCNSYDACPTDPTNTCISLVDTDIDGVPDGSDNCPTTSNADQQNHDDDALGDACDTCTDADNDGVGDAGFTTTGCLFPNIADNCRFKENPIIPPELVQDDTDADGMGDACDVCPGDADLPLTPANESDTDGDGICNSNDICPADPMNACSSFVDTDTDGVPDNWDNCPTIINADQQNHDDDALGDACDTCTDADNDGVGDTGFTTTGCPIPNIADNCTFKANPIIPPELVQDDTDADGMGDACDVCPADADNAATAVNESDTDGDGRCNAYDICPSDPMNACVSFTDTDLDGIPDDWDNCSMTSNLNQADYDGDGTGDACDVCTDTDQDGFGDPGFALTGCTNTLVADNCIFKAGTNQVDTDGDGLGNICDPCPTDTTNACDPGDIDADGTQNGDDNCISTNNADQADTDGDSIGDLCDRCPSDPTNVCLSSFSDADGDLIPDPWDNCVATENPKQTDRDSDGIGDECDTCTDVDGDGVGDKDFNNTTCEIGGEDNCPFLANPDQDDIDADGEGDECDAPIAVIPANSLVGGGGGPNGVPGPINVPGPAPESVNKAPKPNIVVKTKKPKKEDAVPENDSISSKEEIHEEDKGTEPEGCSMKGGKSVTSFGLMCIVLILLKTFARQRETRQTSRR